MELWPPKEQGTPSRDDYAAEFRQEQARVGKLLDLDRGYPGRVRRQSPLGGGGAHRE